MLRKILILFVCAGGLFISSESLALDKRPSWQVLDEALTYLHSVPEVAWVKFHEHTVFISWKNQSRNFARINTTAARKAAHALHNEVTVYSLPPGETLPEELWNYEPNFLCKTIANPQEIIVSNCR